jgi:hypothetical protein
MQYYTALLNSKELFNSHNSGTDTAQIEVLTVPAKVKSQIPGPFKYLTLLLTVRDKDSVIFQM